MEPWPRTPVVSQFTYTKLGNWSLDGKGLEGSAADWSEYLTGLRDWTDVRLTAQVTPLHGRRMGLLMRVQGARRYYGLWLDGGNKITLAKRTDDALVTLLEAPFTQQHGKRVCVAMTCMGDEVSVTADGAPILRFTDPQPLRFGQVGLGVYEGSRCRFEEINIKELRVSCMD